VPRAQLERGVELLRFVAPTTLNHGVCTGADEALALAACDVTWESSDGPVIVGFPANDVPEWFRSKTAPSDFLQPAAPALQRNQAMVDVSDVVLALPSVMDASAKSGTWSTIRKALKADLPLVLVVGPDGTLWRRGSLDRRRR
jgi:hypothetical protein